MKFDLWYVDDLNCNGIVGKLSYKNGVNYFLVYVIFVNCASSEVMFMEKKSQSLYNWFHMATST